MAPQEPCFEGTPPTWGPQMFQPDVQRRSEGPNDCFEDEKPGERAQQPHCCGRRVAARRRRLPAQSPLRAGERQTRPEVPSAEKRS